MGAGGGDALVESERVGERAEFVSSLLHYFVIELAVPGCPAAMLTASAIWRMVGDWLATPA